MKSTIVYNMNGTYHYYDMHGNELHEGDIIRFNNGVNKPSDDKELYRTISGYLGTDATNHVWVENGRSVSCEYGIYPLEQYEMHYVELVRRANEVSK